jgi:predicted anti-sigma-YlaC factor YlaD
MLSCKKATMLVEKQKAIGTVSGIQKMQLKIHLSMCKACKGYIEQSKLIDKSLQQLNDQSPENTPLPNATKKQIIKKIKEI